jgi:RNA recognition motif-containing protein
MNHCHFSRYVVQDFYEDIFEELSKYGEIENLNVCDNLADHMIGNVFVKFREEEYAAAALNALNGRFYAGVWSIFLPTLVALLILLSGCI